MAITRRAFVSALGLGGTGLLAPAWLNARGTEGRRGAWADGPEPAAPVIRLDSNENPNGPGPRAIEAIRGMFGDANRYPFAHERALVAAIAAEHRVAEGNIVLGCGSGEILRICVEAFVTQTQPLVTASPTFESPANFARTLGRPVSAVPVDARLRLDLAAMADKAHGAGLVFFCNPNNPTATVHGADAVRSFVTRVRRESPGTTILIDEAYHEYVEDATYRTSIPLAITDPHVIVSRTFSKVFGMAGLRVGYAIAHADTAGRMQSWRVGSGVNVLAAAAAAAAIGDHDHIAAEQKRNRDARAFTRAFFEKAGYQVGASDTNFLMIDLRRDIVAVRDACQKEGVAVGRPFPPLTRHLRVSIGTLDEMSRATAVFARVLGIKG